MHVRRALTVLASTGLVMIGLAQPAAAGLVAYWPFDNTESNAVSGGPVGALQAGASFSTAQTAPVPVSTHSLSVSGSGGQEFAVSGPGDLTALDTVFSGNFAISFWARSNVNASGQGEQLRYMFDFGNAHGSGVGVVFNDSHGSFGGDTNTIGFYYTNTARDSGVAGLQDTWYHVVLNRQNTTTTLYVDGTAEGTPVTNTANIDGGYPFVIGGESKSASRGWNGYLDDVAVWNRSLRPSEIQQLASGTVGPQGLPAAWDFRGDAFDNASAPDPNQAVGPWIDGGRWRYGTQSTVTDQNYASSNVGEFVDFAHFASNQWQFSASYGYPSVRISDDTLHAGNTSTPDQDTVVTWEADFTGFVDVDYESSANGSGDAGYQMLQWDASAGQMRVLQQRQTYSGGGSGSGALQVRTRVQPGDRILFVLDNATTVGGDRANYSQMVTLGNGPQFGDSWSFSGDKFDDTSLADGAGPWRNSARWRYMSSGQPIDYSYSSPGDFTDLPDFVSGGGNETWQVASGYPQVRISNESIHPGATEQVVVAWEADFTGYAHYDYDLSKYYSYTSVQYQLLQWDASLGVMDVLHLRETLDDGEPALVGRTFVDIGDLLYLVVDNSTGDPGGDRVYFAATITVVPEPTTWILGASGLVGLGLLIRRRRRR